MCVVIFSATSILNILGTVLNVVTWLTLLVLDPVLYLFGMFLFNTMSFHCVFPLLGSHVVVPLVYSLFPLKLSFLVIFNFLI